MSQVLPRNLKHGARLFPGAQINEKINQKRKVGLIWAKRAPVEWWNCMSFPEI